MSKKPVDYCLSELRQNDRDHYVTLMFAPDERRPGIAGLYCFGVELRRIPFLVNELTLGEIRLQWWRDAIAGLYAREPAKHPVLEVLSSAMTDTPLSRIFFERMIDSQSHDLRNEGFEDTDKLLRYAEARGASLLMLALEALGHGEDEAARRAALNVGIAWSLMETVRDLPLWAGRRRVLLPRTLLARFDLNEEDVIRGRRTDFVGHACADILRLAEKHLALARELHREIPKTAHAPLMFAGLAEQYIARMLATGGYPHTEVIRLNPLKRPLSLWLRSLRGAY